MDTVHCLRVGEIATNCWIYPLEAPSASDSPSHNDSGRFSTAPRACAVIDPGDEAVLIIDHLRKLNLCPKYILLTHGHFDHLGALPDLVRVFPALIAIHRNDSMYLGPMAHTAHLAVLKAAMGSVFFQDAFDSFPEPGMLLSDGEELDPFKVIHLPGHTPGSIAFYDEKANVLFSGDTLFCGDCGRTDLPGGSRSELEQSLKRLFSMKGSIRVLPGHGPETTIQNESDRGIFF